MKLIAVFLISGFISRMWGCSPTDCTKVVSITYVQYIDASGRECALIQCSYETEACLVTIGLFNQRYIIGRSNSIRRVELSCHPVNTIEVK